MLEGIRKDIERLRRAIILPSRDSRFEEESQRLEKSLYLFLQAAWAQIEGIVPFQGGWALEAVCEHIQAVFLGEIKKLIISVPPRSGKTSALSIAGPAWVWSWNPAIKFVFNSYAQKISFDHSRLCKLLIESPWYQQRWGYKVKLSADQSTKSHFTTTALGHRISTSVQAGGTSLGGDFLISDDPNDLGEGKATRDATNDWFDRVWPSRLNPNGVGGEILTQQRSHIEDVTGHVLARQDADEWVKLVLPMEYETARKTKTIILPSSNGKVWEDPRTTEGELLCPEYRNEAAVGRKKTELGSYNYASQYQQRPSPEGGGLIKKDWFAVWKEEKPPKMEYVLLSWDTAFTARDTDASYSAATCWGIFKYQGVPNVMLLSAWRDRVGFPELLQRAIRLARNWGDIGVEPQTRKHTMMPDEIIIEKKASGHSITSEFVSKGVPVHGFNPDKYGDKMQRVHKITPYIETGLVWVAAQPPNFLRLRSDHQMLIDNCESFPVSDSRDIVDSMSQALLYIVREKGLLRHRLDFGFKDWSPDDDFTPGRTRDDSPEVRKYFGLED